MRHIIEDGGRDIRDAVNNQAQDVNVLRIGGVFCQTTLCAEFKSLPNIADGFGFNHKHDACVARRGDNFLKRSVPRGSKQVSVNKDQVEFFCCGAFF